MSDAAWIILGCLFVFGLGVWAWFNSRNDYEGE